MLARYPATYRDRVGEVATTIENDGKTLRMVVRDVEFTGSMFDDWEPTSDFASPQLAGFTLWEGILCSCVIECEIRAPSTACDSNYP